MEVVGERSGGRVKPVYIGREKDGNAIVRRISCDSLGDEKHLIILQCSRKRETSSFYDARGNENHLHFETFAETRTSYHSTTLAETRKIHRSTTLEERHLAPPIQSYFCQEISRLLLAVRLLFDDACACRTLHSGPLRWRTEWYLTVELRRLYKFASEMHLFRGHR